MALVLQQAINVDLQDPAVALPALARKHFLLVGRSVDPGRVVPTRLQTIAKIGHFDYKNVLWLLIAFVPKLRFLNEVQLDQC